MNAIDVKLSSEISAKQDELLMEIHDSNLNYLMLSQQLIRNDKIDAMMRLGVNEDVADLLLSLTNSQIMKLANSNMMLTRFRFDDRSLLSMLTDYDKSIFQSVVHTSMLTLNQNVETLG